MKTPRLPKDWTWDLDRTGDVVAVQISNATWTLVYVVLVGNPRTFRLHLHRLRLMALWAAIVSRPLEEFVIETRARYAHWRQERADARSEAQSDFAASVDGLYNHKGELIERPDTVGENIRQIRKTMEAFTEAFAKR